MSLQDLALAMPDVEARPMSPEHQVIATKCVRLLQRMPFSTALLVMANMLCSASQTMGVEKRLVMEMVDRIWESMLELRKPEAKG